MAGPPQGLEAGKGQEVEGFSTCSLTGVLGCFTNIGDEPHAVHSGRRPQEL